MYQKILEDKDPAICELILDHDQIQGPKAINRRDKNGNLQQTSLEDSYPFFSEEELKSNLKSFKGCLILEDFFLDIVITITDAISL